MAKKDINIEEVEVREVMKEPVKLSFSLPNRIVKVKPILRKGWLPTGHDGEFKYSMTKDIFCCPIDSSGNFVKVLNEEERLHLEKMLNLPSGAMSHYSKSSPKSGKYSFWSSRTTSISLNRDGTLLDLSDPTDYANYKVLLNNVDLISPSWDERHNKATYKYALVDEKHEELTDFRKAEEESEAWAKYFEMGSSEDEMKDFLTVFHNKKIPADASKKWLLGQLGKCVRENMSKFMALANDPTYRTKVFLEKAVDAGVVKKKGRNYYFIGNVETIFSQEEILQELDPVNNSERYLTIKTQIGIANDSK